MFLPGESQGQGSLVGCAYGVAQSQTQLKRLSSSSELGIHQKVLGKVIIPSNFFPPNSTTLDDVLRIDYRGNKQRRKLDKKLINKIKEDACSRECL